VKSAFLINSLAIGGAERVVVEIAGYCSRRGEAPLVFLFEEPAEAFAIPPGVATIYLSLRYPRAGLLKLLALPVLALRLKKAIRTEGIDRVQSHLYRANYVNILAKLLGSGHEAQIVNHGTFSRYRREGLTGLMNMALVAWLYPRADGIVVISEGAKRDLAEGLRALADKQISVINNPCDLGRIRRSLELPRSAYVKPPGRIAIASLGRLVRLKRVDLVIEAVARLSMERDDLELVVVGDGPERAALEGLAARLGVRARFLGMRTEPFGIIAEADILVLASESEGFPNSLLEGLACGLPVVASDCQNGPREILRKEYVTEAVRSATVCDFGILFPEGDLDALVFALRMMIEDQGLRKHLAGKAAGRAADFDIELIGKSYADLLYGDGRPLR
jgi:glycosyltransferase involved in cell wall biosynthesis